VKDLVSVGTPYLDRAVHWHSLLRNDGPSVHGQHCEGHCHASLWHPVLAAHHSVAEADTGSVPRTRLGSASGAMQVDCAVCTRQL